MTVKKMGGRETECKASRTDKMLPELNETGMRIVRYEEKDPALIWHDALYRHPDDHRDFLNLCRFFKDSLFSDERWTLPDIAASAMYTMIYQRHGSFIQECDWLAGQTGGVLTPARMALVQRLYSWAHLGCSTLVVWDDEGKENVCMRSLDWQGARAIGQATRIYHFKGLDDDPTKEFAVVGNIGMLGVLTGRKKGFSAAINYAPWYKHRINFDTEPTFRLRQLFQDPSIDSFAEALRDVEGWQVSAPVFVTICGKEKDQACVVEIGGDGKKHTRFARDGVLVETNTFDPDGPFAYVEEKMPAKKKQCDYPVDEKGDRLPDDDWYCGRIVPSAARRRDILEKEFRGFSGSSAELEALLVKEFQKPPIWNWETAYWTLIRPGSGKMRVFPRRVETAC